MNCAGRPIISSTLPNCGTRSGATPPNAPSDYLIGHQVRPIEFNSFGYLSSPRIRRLMLDYVAETRTYQKQEIVE